MATLPTKPITLKLSDIEPFKAMCQNDGFAVRMSKGLDKILKPDFDVRFNGQWMSVKYNKAANCMTVDKRLVPLYAMYQQSLSRRV